MDSKNSATLPLESLLAILDEPPLRTFVSSQKSQLQSLLFIFFTEQIGERLRPHQEAL